MSSLWKCANTQVLPLPLHITLLGYFNASVIPIPLQLYFVINSLLSTRGLACSPCLGCFLYVPRAEWVARLCPLCKGDPAGTAPGGAGACMGCREGSVPTSAQKIPCSAPSSLPAGADASVHLSPWHPKAPPPCTNSFSFGVTFGSSP